MYQSLIAYTSRFVAENQKLKKGLVFAIYNRRTSVTYAAELFSKDFW